MILDIVKTALRTTTTDENLIAHFNLLIDTCVEDLRSSNIKCEKDEEGNYSPLITSAICIFAKANFSNSELSEMYMRSYLSMKTQLSILGEYNND